MGYKILSKTELCPNQYELVIEAPFVVKNAKAGQFIIFRAEENGERVPLTIADVNKETGALTIVFMAVGYSTKKLAELCVGSDGKVVGIDTKINKIKEKFGEDSVQYKNTKALANLVRNTPVVLKVVRELRLQHKAHFISVVGGSH